MLYTNEQKLLLAEKARELLDSQTKQELDENLQLMLQSYFMYNENLNQKDKDSVYCTFLNLQYFIKQSSYIVNELIKIERATA